MQLFPADRRAWMFAGVRVSAFFLALFCAVGSVGLWLKWAPGSSYRDALPPITPAQQAIAARLRTDVDMLATVIGPRDALGRPKQLAKAAEHIISALQKAGFSAKKRAFSFRKKTVFNIEVTIAGGAQRDEIVVLGAHYDSVRSTPGADDNASGVAVLLELARQLHGTTPARTLRLVFFVNEEPPFFKNALMGSLVYAKAAAVAHERIVAMASLEMLGYYDARPNSQHYPYGLGLVYPNTADFITFVGTLDNRPLVHTAIGAFRDGVQFPSEAITAPTFVNGIDFSDHWAFAQAGFPSFMVSDTSFYRSDHYHKPTDTADTLDYDRMARVTQGLAAVARALTD